MRLSAWFPFGPPVDKVDAARRVHLVKYLLFWRVRLQRERLPGLGWMKCRWMPGRDILA